MSDEQTYPPYPNRASDGDFPFRIAIAVATLILIFALGMGGLIVLSLSR